MKRYIFSDTSIRPSMQKLIDDVANDFKQSMKDMDCTTWSEFVRLNDWEASDIRSEIGYMVDHLYGGAMFDDGTYIEDENGNGISYREFKKNVINQLK